MREKVSNIIKRYWVVLLFFTLNICFYGVFVVKHYAPDTYYTEALGWEVTAAQYWKNGRWLMTLLAKLCGVFHIGPTLEQLFSWGLAIISVTLAAYVVYELLCACLSAKSSLKKRLWVALIAFMLISNVFLLEYFIFAEYSGIMCLGILFDTLAAKYILRALEKGKIRFYVIGVVFGILGINGHQGNFALFVVIAVLCARETLSSIKRFVINNAVIGSAYMIPALINVIETRIGGADRAAQGVIDFGASFIKATEGLKQLFLTGAFFMPHGTYLGFVILFFACFLVGGLKKRSFRALLYFIYTGVIIILGIYAPLMVTAYDAIDVVPRTVYIMGGLIPVILAIMLIHMDISIENTVIVPALTVCFLLVQYYGAMQLITDHYKTNLLDRYEAQFVGAEIWEYEERTGITVSKMALYWDENVTGYAPDVRVYGAVNERAMSNEWAAPLAIRCLDGHVLQQTDPSDEVYEKYFKGKDWLHIKDEQLVIIGDTLHMCAY